MTTKAIKLTEEEAEALRLILGAVCEPEKDLFDADWEEEKVDRVWSSLAEKFNLDA